MCTMAINNQYNGIEITFEGKPTEATRTALKQAGFRWHGQKRLWYAKNTAERLALAQKLSGQNSDPGAAPAATVKIVSKYGLKEGDILYDTWGYEQTNVEFYQVKKILSACKVEIVKIAYTVDEYHSPMSGTCVPSPDSPIGSPVQKMVTQSSYEKRYGGWHIKIDECVSLTPWDGHSVSWSSWY